MLVVIRILVVLVVCLITINFGIQPTWASIQIDGQIKATKTCAAVQSIRMGANPDRIYLVKGKVYHVIAKDRNNESHYLIEMPEENITPSVRWIAKNCGEYSEVNRENN